MTPTRIDGNVTMPDPPQPARRFANGDEILGRYVVQAELGQGGMGVVYKCFDKIGGVEVAVKGLPPEVSHNSDEMEAVRDNFQLVHELHHSNIAGVLTLERDAATGDYYLVMTLARGVSLRHWLRQHGGKEHRAEQLNVLRQIASALDYAHNAEPKHIIHRDVKPENIMVDDGGHVMVLDFGLAAQVRSSLSHVSRGVTSRSGTPTYKSPEQWLAQVQRVPSDQYSLGVIAYQMFAGELPFDSDDIEILKHAVVFDPVSDIAGEAKAVNLALAKALAKKPQERFASCTAFVDALEGACTDARGLNRTLAEDDEMPDGKDKALVAIAASALALGALVVGGWWWQTRNRSNASSSSPSVPAVVATPTLPSPRVTPPVVTQVIEKVIEKSAPVVAAKVDEDADRRRQAEVAKLAKTRTWISIKVAAAKDDYAKVAPYRAERVGFESHLSEIDRQWKTVEGVQNPKSLVEAEKTLAAVTEAADTIAFELNWLKTNRDGRDAAKRIEKEIAEVTEYDQNLELGDAAKEASSASADVKDMQSNTDSFLGLKFGEKFNGAIYVNDPDEPTLLRATFKPKIPLAKFDDYYVFVTPKTHKIVKIYACAKNEVENGVRWRRHYLIEALEKSYQTWARPRSVKRPIYSFDLGGGRYVTVCLSGTSKDYETVIAAWDDELLSLAADEAESVRMENSKTAAENRKQRVDEAANLF